MTQKLCRNAGRNHRLWGEAMQGGGISAVENVRFHDYVTAIAGSSNQPTLAIASAAGEIVLVNPETQKESLLQETNGQSINCLAFSSDSQYLAAGS